jgi:hypothetical protein
MALKAMRRSRYGEINHHEPAAPTATSRGCSKILRYRSSP